VPVRSPVGLDDQDTRRRQREVVDLCQAAAPVGQDHIIGDMRQAAPKRAGYRRLSAATGEPGVELGRPGAAVRGGESCCAHDAPVRRGRSHAGAVRPQVAPMSGRASTQERRNHISGCFSVYS